MARQRTAHKSGGKRRPKNSGPARSDYFIQPGKRGAIVVLRKPCGNRITPKVCGVMPSAQHAKMLIAQLQKAESVVGDLFLEATDDGIEALEAVLAACRDDVLKRLPVRDGGPRRDRDRGRGRGPRDARSFGDGDSGSDAAASSETEEGTPGYAPPASPAPLDEVVAESEPAPADELESEDRPAPRKRRAPRKRAG